MKPIDIENRVLLVLQRAGRLTIAKLHRRLTPATGQGPIWRQVANAVYRLERQGLVHIVGDELVGDVSLPLFGLSPAGVQEAQQVASLRPGALAVPQAEGEVGHA